MKLPVVDERRIHGPAYSRDWPGGQSSIQNGPFADQGKAISCFDEGLHLGWMGSPREFFDLHSALAEPFHKLCMGFWMLLRVVEDRKVALQVCRPKRHLACKRMVDREASHEPVTADCLSLEVRLGGLHHRYDLAA
jgi:hypothetical protein